MSFSAEDYDTEEVTSLERRPPDRGGDRFWIRNAVIEQIRRDRNIFYVTIRYRASGNQNRDRDGDWDRDGNRDRDRGQDWDRDRGPDRGQGRGPGQGQNQMQVLRLVVGNETRIVNRNGRDVSPKRLEAGMRIDALVSSAMTRSMPPQTRAFEILIDDRRDRNRVTTGRIIQVDVRNRFIITVNPSNFSNAIRFNLSPDTVILGLNGRRIALRDLFPGLRVRVEHSPAMTASIPPQTTAFEIRVIP